MEGQIEREQRENSYTDDNQIREQVELETAARLPLKPEVVRRYIITHRTQKLHLLRKKL